MNTPSDAADTPESEAAPKAKKQISAKRRLISWAFIAVLLIVVLIEWRAKSSQAATFKNLEAAMENSGDVGEIPFRQLESITQGSPSEEIDESGALLRLHHYRWKGLFKVYHLRLLVDKDEKVIAFDGLAGGEPVGGIPRISKERMKNFLKKEKAANGGTPVETESVEVVEEAPAETKKQ
ncbi:hypothetical protein [Gimesia aquarii]|uniref:Uncharacterized protein n=1 Tax=Gimesia aquarii TaxID=2527964 RepID=A0A517WPA2_9PLAN|nr:hypothetical protein [Gimesia aquarii]QDU07056.1 hypothetical protein V202x_04010 [Gimesia aquarii]